MNYIEEIAKLVPIPADYFIVGTGDNGTTYDYEPIRAIIEDSGMDVVRNVQRHYPQDLNLFTTRTSMSGISFQHVHHNLLPGIDFETGIVDHVERANKACIEIPATKKNMAKDSDSLHYATPEYPCFYRENGKLFIIPEPGEGGTTFEDSVPIFSRSPHEFVGGAPFNFTYVHFTSALLGTVESRFADLISHNLASGDYIKFHQNSNDYDASSVLDTLPEMPVIRRSGTVLEIPLPYQALINFMNYDEATATTEDHYIDASGDLDGGQEIEGVTYHIINPGIYNPIPSNSFAHIVRPPTTQMGEVVTMAVDFTEEASGLVDLEIIFDITNPLDFTLPEFAAISTQDLGNAG